MPTYPIVIQNRTRVTDAKISYSYTTQDTCDRCQHIL